MHTEEFKIRFRSQLIEWYYENKRDLPWRETQEAYTIWLSEIILQQTRVNQGLPYFYKFIEQYPNVRALAFATEDKVLRDWEGLGYYTRARNLKKAAEMVVDQFDGVFPTSYTDLLRLPGIGDYTASAVSSFSSNEARAVLDGNVFRVLARIFGIDSPINSSVGKKVFHTLAQEMLDKQYSALYNQAIMEFGAMHCKPVSPLCEQCPFSMDCLAKQQNLISILPIKIKAKPLKERFLNYFLIEKNAEFLIKQRGIDDIWAKMYEFPVLETQKDFMVFDHLEWKHQISDTLNIEPSSIENLEPIWGPFKHLLSHQKIFVRVFRMHLKEVNPLILKDKGYRFIDLDDFLMLAKPKVIQVFLEKFF